MTARNFSEDGAAGAMTGNSPATGSQTGGVTSGTLAPNFNMTGDSGAIDTDVGGIGSSALGAGGWGGGGLSGGSSDSGSTISGSSSGGWGGGGMSAPMGSTKKATSSPAGYGGDDWRSQINQQPGWANNPWAGMAQDTGGFNTVTTSFAEGGAIDEGGGDPNATDPQGSAMGNSLQQSINQALATVGKTLSYGRQLHGIGGGQKQAMNDEGFRKSDNVEDRTGNDQSDQGRISNNVSNNWANMKDKASSLMAPDPTKNKMSQDAGINDLGGDGGTATPGAQQAIPTDEEEAQ